MRRILLYACLAFWSASATAQPEAAGSVASPILTLDEDALFLQSQFGLRVQHELEQARSALASENRRIEADLIEEERQLTERRKELPPEAFAPLAAVFDEKVQRIRREQDAKSLDLQRRLDQERQEFLSRVGPVLADLARSRGAAVIVDRNAILMALEGVDVTSDAVELLDRRIGDGAALQEGPQQDEAP